MAMTKEVTELLGRFVWAGKIGPLPYEPLTDDERDLFEMDFSILVEKVNKIDPDVGAELDNRRAFFMEAAAIAKGHWHLPFGGIEPTTGQFGMAFITSQAFLGANTWSRSLSAGWNDLFGSSTSPISGNNTAPNRRMYMYGAVLVASPTNPIRAIRLNANGYDYPVLSLEDMRYVKNIGKYYTVISLPKVILIHPTGSHYVRALSDTAVTIDVLPIGIMFAEFDYLKTEGNFWIT